MIVLRDVCLRRGARTVLDRASLTLHAGEKVGLVGRNGAGKSSLFALLRGELHEDGGEVAMPAHWRIAHVAQDMPATDISALDFVLAGDTALVAAQAQLAAAQAQGDGNAIALAHAALDDANAHDAPARAEALLLGLGFAAHEVKRAVTDFSGGWRMRLQLARALMCPSDLLLLDEPTNHLDLDALVWLEGWLQRYTGLLVVISHDREFLDAVTQVTVHLENGRLTRYGGHYSRFEEMRAQQLAQQQAAYERQQAQIARVQRFVERFRAKATKARQAQSRLKALARMERVAPLVTSESFNLNFDPPGTLPNPMLTLHDLAVGYPAPSGGAPRCVVQGIVGSVLPGQRIGILGANGQGKSTFVKTIAGVLPPLAGQLLVGKGLRIGYFAQHELDILRADETPLQHLLRLVRELQSTDALAGQPTREQDLRDFLGRFQFTGDSVAQPVGTLSGGEKARLVLALLVWQRPHLLLLDEPTNHLDLPTRDALALALNDFEGSVMLVSHDRALLRTVCDHFWLVSGGRLQPFDGDLDDYQRHLQELARQGRSRASMDNDATRGATGLTPAERRRQEAQRRQQLAQALKPLQREQQALEARLDALHLEQAQLHTQLAQPQASADLAVLGRRLKTIASEIASIEERWLELGEAIEALQRSSTAAESA